MVLIQVLYFLEIVTPRCQAIADLVESIALQETALANILNAEGMKVQAFIKMEDVTVSQMLKMNRLVTRQIGAVSQLESVLRAKLQTVSCQFDECGEE